MRLVISDINKSKKKGGGASLDGDAKPIDIRLFRLHIFPQDLWCHVQQSPNHVLLMKSSCWLASWFPILFTWLLQVYSSYCKPKISQVRTPVTVKLQKGVVTHSNPSKFLIYNRSFPFPPTRSHRKKEYIKRSTKCGFRWSSLQTLKCTLPGCLQVSHHGAQFLPCEDTAVPLLQNSLQKTLQ